MFFEIAVPAVINGEKEFGGTRNIHGAEYKAELQSCKAPERRSRDAHPVRALRSFGIKMRAPMPVGMPTLGGTLATQGGLVFIAGTQDYYLRAFDTSTGKEV